MSKVSSVIERPRSEKEAKEAKALSWVLLYVYLTIPQPGLSFFLFPVKLGYTSQQLDNFNQRVSLSVRRPGLTSLFSRQHTRD